MLMANIQLDLLDVEKLSVKYRLDGIGKNG